MDNQKKEENCREGRLPAMAPLANPYVPFQLENPPQYEAQKGLVRGTLFPGLDLPFMGMVNLNELPETPSSQMQALAFAVQELALYRRYQQLLEKVRAEYQKCFGPLNHGTPQTSESYQWLDDPWPWEYTTNKEA